MRFVISIWCYEQQIVWIMDSPDLFKELDFRRSAGRSRKKTSGGMKAPSHSWISLCAKSFYCWQLRFKRPLQNVSIEIGLFWVPTLRFWCSEQAMAEVGRKAPQFWSENPAVHFEVLAAKFQQLLDAGKTFDALSLVQSTLTPISNEHKFLQGKLKARLFPSCSSCFSLGKDLPCVTRL